jgi:hypothetical protein
MDRKLLTFGIALVIIAIVVAPVAAKLPAKSPLPPNNPFNIIWTHLQDLQTQINDLTTKINALTTSVTNLATSVTNLATRVTTLENKPAVHFGEWGEIRIDEAIGTYYAGPAETDKIVTATCWGMGPSSIYGYVTMNNDQHHYFPVASNYKGEAWGTPISITMPVRQGEEWYVGYDGCGTFVMIRWVPLSA